MTTTRQSKPPTIDVNRLVPFVHVADVRASLAFYELLGFAPQNVMTDPQGHPYWALAQSDSAEIMLARASGPIDADQQAVLLYMYSTDITGLRQRLLAHGLRNGRTYSGAQSPDDAPGTVYNITARDHMPGGELRLTDPDGYVILVGQPA